MVCFVVAVNHVILDSSQCMETIPGDLPTFHEFGQLYMDFSILDSCIVDNAFVLIHQKSPFLLIIVSKESHIDITLI